MTATPISELTTSTYAAFVRSAPWSVVLLGAPWAHARLIRARLEAAAMAHSDRVAFGAVNTDNEPGIAKGLGLLNLPTVAYYRSGNLVAALTGAQQDVLGRTAALLEGSPLGYEDGHGVV